MEKLRRAQQQRKYDSQVTKSSKSIRAWHAYKYIDPAESGAVLPIVHVNGFKISERTIYGCMDNKEIVALFTGYGYQTRIVEDLEDIDADMVVSMNWALAEIRDIQQAARSGKPIMKPRWPVIILRTPKVSLIYSLSGDVLTHSRDGVDQRS
jgi:xylulose-5-phosphate/fructose-6-phosphate phosphoketolase